MSKCRFSSPVCSRLRLHLGEALKALRSNTYSGAFKLPSLSCKRPDLVARTETPDVLFQAHSAALGLQFYDGKTFPKKYRNGAFVAFRGSWNRDRGTGYKIVFVPFDAKGRSLGYYEDFLTGFLLNPSVPTTWGRPVGLVVLPDGSLLLTEEANNRIYRIQYTEE